jgi:hypothetical protein
MSSNLMLFVRGCQPVKSPLQENLCIYLIAAISCFEKKALFVRQKAVIACMNDEGHAVPRTRLTCRWSTHARLIAEHHSLADMPDYFPDSIPVARQLYCYY